MKKLIPLFCAMFLSITSFAQNQEHVITNQDVVDMVKAQFSTELIIKKIQTTDSVKFDTSVQDLKKLKASGVEERIIMAMLETARIKKGQSVSPKDTVEDKDKQNEPTPNVYLNRDGSFGPAFEQVKTPSAKSAVKPEKLSVKAKSFTFDLDECRLWGDVIACEVLVTNTREERRQLGFVYVSTIVDDQGNERKATLKSIGGNDQNSATLQQGVAVRARLTFEGIQKRPKTVKLLSLSLNTPALIGGRRIAGGGNFQVEFKDISLAQ